jgi:hypothetical protein
LIAKLELVPASTGVTAALEVVAKLKANAAPRTIVRIMDRSLFQVKPA